ncbi:MAG: protein translocase subunit SecDF [Mangrovibacterium sp.]
MQNKGMIRTFAILLALVCVYQLAFTWVARKVESDAAVYAQGDKLRQAAYIDSISGEKVYSVLGLKDYTYRDVKGLEMNLGLDLKGGMNVTLEVSVVELIKAISNNSTDPTFIAALGKAQEMQKNSQEDFVTLFGEAFKGVDPNAQLAAVFNTQDLRGKINPGMTNSEVLSVIRVETEAAIDNAFQVIRQRIDRFGVAQPNIQKLETSGRILVELPGIDNPERVRKLLQGTATLEFWETYENQEVQPLLGQANEIIKAQLALTNPVEEVVNDTTVVAETTVQNDTTSVGATSEEEVLAGLGTAADTLSLDAQQEAFRKEMPLFAVLLPSMSQDGQLFNGPVVGTSHAKDTATVNSYLAMPQVKAVIPNSLKFAWTAAAADENGQYFRLIALKATGRGGNAPLTGDVIVDATQDYSQLSSQPEVSMSMNSEGAKTWARLTKDNVGRSIAISLDGYVISFPTVNGEIKGGRSSITGMESVEAAQDLANILKSGKMPAPAHIVQEEIVGPSLGQEAIESGLWSFAIAFCLILIYMLFFYSKKAGMASDLALILNLFFIIGILASIGAVLTLPGIAGIVLTIGMSVDANVLIYERVQEELNSGKGLKLAIQDGYNNAYSAIIDGNITTFLTGLVLFFFGSGPIKGFATTLMVGIATSLFCAIFITRLIFEWQLSRGKNITFTSKVTEDWLRNTNIKFLEKRKIAYGISIVMIVLSLASIAINGFNYGIDFQGGRSYVVRLNQVVQVADVAEALATPFGKAPEVKTFGAENQVKITTTYKIEELSIAVDEEVDQLLLSGLINAGYIPQGTDVDTFDKDYRMSSSKVGPTISDDIKKDAFIAIGFALLVMFLYILARFSTWQYGLGAVISLAHDSVIVLGVFSMFRNILPFSLEIDQAFIAAILTVVGYSINDTVIVFDRIREYVKVRPKTSLERNLDDAMNSTLRRTFSTSLSTLVVILAIFIFGGTSIRGFVFALLLGIGIGTYSSIFVATPLVYDFFKASSKRKKVESK